MRSAVIVVPCYNEAARFDAGRFLAFAAAAPWVRFVLVDDGSTDGTAAVLETLRQRAPASFEVLRLPTNSGKAEAVRRGLLAACAAGPEAVGYWDADLATPLDAIGDLAAVLDERPGVALVMGSRVKLLGRQIERSAVRHYCGRVFATAVSIILRLGVYDTQCGAKLFRMSEDLPALFAAPFRSRWIFDVEVLARMAAARRTRGLGPLEEAVCEYPLEVWCDVPGSKITAGAIARVAGDLVVLFWESRFGSHTR